MKVFIGLCLMYTFIVGTLANCGCLKVVSPKFSPCKVIYRNNLNCPSAAPYTLQKALVPQPVYIPKEYDYQIRVLPAQPQPCCSSYEYGLQAALIPPTPYIPLSNLRTATERLVMDSPPCPSFRPNCYSGVYKSCLPQPQVVQKPLCYEEEPVSCGCRGPLIEPLCPSLCPSRYDLLNSKGRCSCRSRKKRDLLLGGGKNGQNFPLLELPMNFIFKFIPNLLRGPILTAMHTVHARANAAASRARINTSKNLAKAHTVRAKQKLKNHKLKYEKNQKNYKDKTHAHRLENRLSNNDEIVGSKRGQHPTKMLKETNQLLKELLKSLNEPKNSNSKKHSQQNFPNNFENQKVAKFKDRLLQKLEKFNEDYSNNDEEVYVTKDFLLEKMKEFNNQVHKKRGKRSILLNNEELALPFFEIDDEILDKTMRRTLDVVSEEEEDDLSQERVGRRRHNFDSSELESGEEILRANHPLHEHPFVVLLRTPLKLLHHLHDIRKNFTPILYSFPKLLHSSKKYLTDFGKNLQSGVLDFASNVIGDFDENRPRQYDSLVFPQRRYRRDTEEKRRNKRYILKVVDEEEVQEFLKEKLGNYFEHDDHENHKKSKNEHKTQHEEKETRSVGKSEKKFIVKKLSPKIILDNNGKPFLEIKGKKRPLFFGKKKCEETHEKTEDDSNESEKLTEKNEQDINDRIDEVLSSAKGKLKDEEPEVENCYDEMPSQTIKAKILQTSTDIQNLIKVNFEDYSDLYENLLKIDHLKQLTSEYWKNVMINEKMDELHCKIKILNYFKEMQVEKDKATKKIGHLLKSSNNFIVKILIKTLVKLQKLQCLIRKVVEHFEGRMKIGSMSDTEKEIQFVDSLSSICVVSGKNRQELESALARLKNEALKKQIRILENLRKILQNDDVYTINEVANQIWEMRNIEKLQKEAVDEMNEKLNNNIKIRKELKILFDLSKQAENLEDKCDEFLQKFEKHNVIVGSRNVLKNHHHHLRKNDGKLAELILLHKNRHLDNIRKKSRKSLNYYDLRK